MPIDRLRFTIFILLGFYFFPAFSQNADIRLLRDITSHRTTASINFFKITSNSVAVIPPAYPAFQFTFGLLHKNDSMIREAWFSGIALATASVLTYGIKEIVARPRPFTSYPDIVPLDKAGSKSFPSGHTSIAFCTATCMTLYYKKWYIAVPAYAWAASVGYSRMYLGVHYPTDVLCGMILGTGVPLIIYFIAKKPIDKIGHKLGLYR
jgi:membrane-associated phospholipid phosphatase